MSFTTACMLVYEYSCSNSAVQALCIYPIIVMHMCRCLHAIVSHHNVAVYTCTLHMVLHECLFVGGCGCMGAACM